MLFFIDYIQNSVKLMYIALSMISISYLGQPIIKSINNESSIEFDSLIYKVEWTQGNL